MRVEIENFLLGETVDFFFNMELTNGRESRHRSRLVKALNKQAEKVSEEEQELIKAHSHLDENGEPKTKNDGREYDIKDLDKFAKDMQDLKNEKLVIDDSNSQVMLKTIRTILDNYEGELSGRRAVVYEHLCNIFKVDEDIENESQEA